MSAIINQNKSISLTDSPTARPKGRLVQDNGKVMKVTPHGVGGIIGYSFLAGGFLSCAIVMIVAVSILVGGVGYGVGIPLWYVGAAQASSTMILIGKVFTFSGIGVSVLTGIIALTCLPFFICHSMSDPSSDSKQL